MEDKDLFKIYLNDFSAYATLKIVLGDDEHYTDLDYYCLDNTFFEGESTFAKGFLNFVCMVENWKLKIINLQIGSSDYLPFDYSDQYIGFFIISKPNDELIEIQGAVTLQYQGAGYNPSRLYRENFMHDPYELDGKKYTMPIHQLLENIESSMTTIFSSFYKKNF